MRSEWEERARTMLRNQMVAKGLSYSDLARLLTEAGSPESDQNLRNKIGRGSFTAAFLLKALHVMGSEFPN